jgi:multidrug efflux pump subunit AcrB
MSWVKWYRSKTAWVIIIAAVVAMVGAFLCAYYLAYPLNLITAIACCVPSGIVMRKAIIKAMIKKGEEKE